MSDNLRGLGDKVRTQEEAKADRMNTETEMDAVRTAFRRELTTLINKHGLEGYSGTPDWILANAMINGLDAFDRNVIARDICLEPEDSETET